MRRALVAVAALVWVFVAGIGCSSNGDDGTFPIPEELFKAIPSGVAVSTQAKADFNNDGKDDFVVAYGPIVNNKNTQLRLITDVGGVLSTFTDPVGLQFKIDDYNGDGVDDFGVWSGNPATWRILFWSEGAWAEM